MRPSVIHLERIVTEGHTSRRRSVGTLYPRARCRLHLKVPSPQSGLPSQSIKPVGNSVPCVGILSQAGCRCGARLNCTALTKPILKTRHCFIFPRVLGDEVTMSELEHAPPEGHVSPEAHSASNINQVTHECRTTAVLDATFDVAALLLLLVVPRTLETPPKRPH